KTVASNGNEIFKAKIKLWDVTTGEVRGMLNAEFDWMDSEVRCMAFSPDGKVVAGITEWGGRMIFWNPGTGKLLRKVRFAANTCSIEFSPDGKILASTNPNGTVELWDSAKLIPQE